MSFISRSRAFLMALVALAAAVAPARAQQRDTTPAPRATTAHVTAGAPTWTPNRDVILEVPQLSVDSIGLTVNDLRAHVSLEANAMNFVQINAGVDAGIRKVQLGITGVYGEVYLYADLDNVGRIVNRVVQTLDRNPQILTQLLKTVDTTVNAATGKK